MLQNRRCLLLVLCAVLAGVLVAGGCAGDETGLVETPPGETGSGPGDGNSDTSPDPEDGRIPSDAPQMPEELERTDELLEVPVYQPVSPFAEDGDGVAFTYRRGAQGSARAASSVDTNDRAEVKQSLNQTADWLAGHYGLRAGNGNEYLHWLDTGEEWYGWPLFPGGELNAGGAQGLIARGMLAAVHFDLEANAGSGLSPANITSDIYTSGPGPVTPDHDGYLGTAFDNQDDAGFRLYCADISYQMEYANLAQDPSEASSAQAAFQRLIDAFKDPLDSGVVGGGPYHHGSNPDNSTEDSARNLVDFFIHTGGRLGGWHAAQCAVAAERTGNIGYAEAILDHLLDSAEQLDGEGPESGWRTHPDNPATEDMSMGALLSAMAEVDFLKYRDTAKSWAVELVEDYQSRSYGYFGNTEDADGEHEPGEFLTDHTQQHAWIMLGLTDYLKARKESEISGGDPGSITALINIAVNKAQEWLFSFALKDSGTYRLFVIGNTGQQQDVDLQVNGTVLRSQAFTAENMQRFPSRAEGVE